MARRAGVAEEALRLGLGLLHTTLRAPWPLPWRAQIEITSRCNLACPMCPRQGVRIANEHVPSSTVKRIIERLTGVDSLALVGLGEPLLHPDLLEILAASHERGMRTQITTNGIVLRDEEAARRLVESSLDTPTFSLEAVPTQYSFGHANPDIAQTVTRVVRLREALGRRTPRLVVQVAVFSENLDEIPALVSWAAGTGWTSCSKGCPACSIDTSSLTSASRTFCYKWLDYVFVKEEGDVYPCVIASPDMIMGNLLHEDPRSIWKGRRYRALGRGEITLELCTRCDMLRLRNRTA